MSPMCLDDYEDVRSLTPNSDSASRAPMKITNLQTRLWLDTDEVKDVLYCAISRHATNIMSGTQTMTTDS
ncbi:hypothetical protein N7537_009286 [Penicillium hordei]|uniref:Uncharacterized protein n=1 Tax=Penicillium hordei TaxID=40994 RepID=A0AAD6GWG2_9EURO|nr:uncharacterized protein N7537_009286 [Penicillium hordei]KAJ5592382.1 hypothetical protein N7537_009286 [Penicillium hordei]